MKRQSFLAIPFLILIGLLVKPVFAESVTTGNASAKSTVETKIEGTGSVTTRIEVEANGEKKVLDANKPGNYSVSVESKSNSNEASSSSTPSATPDTDNNKDSENSEKSSFLSAFLKNIRNFFERILDFF